MSKGSAPRPLSVSDQEYAERWDAIFAKRMDEQKPESVQPYVQADQALDYTPTNNAQEEGQ